MPRHPRDRAFAPLILALLALVLVVAFVVFLAAAVFLGWVTGGFGHVGFMPIVGVGGSILWLAVLVVIITLVFRAIQDDEGEDAAIEELRRAYARGDIGDEEYDARLERLQGER